MMNSKNMDTMMSGVRNKFGAPVGKQDRVEHMRMQGKKSKRKSKKKKKK